MHHESTGRALVLGGGGSVGNAWLIGLLAGLHDAGLDVTGADLIVGTSAGATAAAQITNAPLPELYAATRVPPPARPAPGGRPADDHLTRTQRVIDASADPGDMRRRMGALFLELDLAAGGGSDAWRRAVAARLPGYDWPATRLLIPAVDADTGAPVVFDRDAGVELVDAVAASTAGGAAYRIGDRRYIDGGYRRNENADLAAGVARVLVLAPFGGRARTPLAWRSHLVAQVEDLVAGGGRVEVVGPDAASVAAFGGNMLDLTRRGPTAWAGFAQGVALAPSLAAFWR